MYTKKNRVYNKKININHTYMNVEKNVSNKKENKTCDYYSETEYSCIPFGRQSVYYSDLKYFRLMPINMRFVYSN